MELQWHDLPNDVPDYGPMHPMPIAGREKVLRWLGRIRTGALLHLALIVLGVLVYLSMRPWSGKPTVVLPPWLTQPVFLVGALVALWLVTTPEPENSGWLRRRRWIVRIGYGVSLILMVTMQITEGGHVSQTRQVPPLLASISTAVWLANAVVILSYYRQLAVRLRDSLLRKNYTVLFGIVLVLAGLLALLLILGLLMNYL